MFEILTIQNQVLCLDMNMYLFFCSKTRDIVRCIQVTLNSGCSFPHMVSHFFLSWKSTQYTPRLLLLFVGVFSSHCRRRVT